MYLEMLSPESAFVPGAGNLPWCHHSGGPLLPRTEPTGFCPAADLENTETPPPGVGSASPSQEPLLRTPHSCRSLNPRGPAVALARQSKPLC